MPATLSTSQYVAATADRIRSQVSRLGVLSVAGTALHDPLPDRGAQPRQRVWALLGQWARWSNLCGVPPCVSTFGKDRANLE
jgi:hypothetical protein